MNKDAIIAKITTTVMHERVPGRPEVSNLGMAERCIYWNIGAIDDPARLKRDLGSVQGCRCWEADNEAVASEVMDHFRGIGMHLVTNVGENPTHIYIYRT